MLDAREARQQRQRDLLARFGKPLICFTMNIAGSVKDAPMIRYAFFCGLTNLLERLGQPLYQSFACEKTGCIACLIYDDSAQVLKAAAIALESTDVGRLYDIDVLDADGTKLSRAEPRRCLVCGEPVPACARSRAHGLPAVVARTNALLTDFCAQSLSQAACDALLREVHLTPKPGLVDQNNTGAHTDMDVPMFERSALALRPSFMRAFRIGMSEEAAFSDLRQCGLEAEAEMYRATGGVNTHKGAIYSFLLLLGALGRVAAVGGDVFETVRGFCLQDDRVRDRNTHGTTGYIQYGALGARGEAIGGFPHAREACRLLRQADVWDALLYLLSEMDDTNVLYRGGGDALRFLQQSASAARRLTGDARLAALLELDAACIYRNISPGGCADMLALAMLLDATRGFWEKKPA